jgi:hypothetical protein
MRKRKGLAGLGYKEKWRGRERKRERESGPSVLGPKEEVKENKIETFGCL